MLKGDDVDQKLSGFNFLGLSLVESEIVFDLGITWLSLVVLRSFGCKWPREPDHSLLQTLWFTQSQNLLFWLGPSRLLVLQMLTANELVPHVPFEWVIRFHMEWNLLQQFMFSESLGDQKNLWYMECFRIVKILIDGYFVNFFKSWFNLIMILINSLS